MLLDKLPEACGYKNKKYNGFGKALKKSLQEIKNAYPEMKEQQANRLKKIFGLRNGDNLAKLRSRSTEVCEQLKEYTLDRNMHIFIDGITTDFGDDESWLERVISLTVGKPAKELSLIHI